MIELPRRQLLMGLGAALAAPAIVRFESLMPVKALPLKTETSGLVLVRDRVLDGNALKKIFSTAAGRHIAFERCFFTEDVIFSMAEIARGGSSHCHPHS